MEDGSDRYRSAKAELSADASAFVDLVEAAPPLLPELTTQQEQAPWEDRTSRLSRPPSE